MQDVDDDEGSPAATGGWTPALCSSPLHSAGLSMENPFEMFDEVGRSLKWFNLPGNAPAPQQQQKRRQAYEDEASYDSDSSSIGSYFSRPRTNGDSDIDDHELHHAAADLGLRAPVQIVLPPRCTLDNPSRISEESKAFGRNEELYPFGPVPEAEAEAPGDPVSGLVRTFFGTRQDIQVKRDNSGEDSDNELVALKKQMEALEDDNLRYRKESQRINRMLKERESDAARLAHEKAMWENRKESELQAFRNEKDELSLQLQQLRREKRLLEKQAQCMLQLPKPLPNKQERREIADLKAKLVDVHEEHLKKEARLRLTNTRLRKLVKELTGRLNEKHEETKRYEKLLSDWNCQEELRSVLEEEDVVVKVNEKTKRPKAVECLGTSVGCRITGGLFHQRTDPARTRKEALNDVSETRSGIKKLGDTRDAAARPNCIDEHEVKRSGVADEVQIKTKGCNRKASKAEDQQQLAIVQASGRTKMELTSRDKQALLDKTVSTGVNPLQRRSMLFPDGTREEEYIDGLACIYFPNGDIKNTLADGTTEYYYSEIDTWHTTKANGVEVFYFPHNQIEEHWPDGRRRVIYPDGSSRITSE